MQINKLKIKHKKYKTRELKFFIAKKKMLKMISWTKKNMFFFFWKYKQ